MSIFKDTFKTEIQNQLNVRQEAIFRRTPTAIQYFNARNAWIRMSSSVNVNGSNELAQKYVLQGGVLANGNQPLSGVGLINQAYSLNTTNNQPHRLGIKPMPGITGINVKSKSAYGSLREVEIKFNAWDIKQLEELELLYMRPGYTALIEWGWAPYLDNNSALQASNISFYDIINQTPPKEKIFKDLYDTATKTYGGNYDALFGYVKNYSWSARDDGGYDCTTTLISVGEVMESLKVNYSPFNNMNQYINGGVLLSGADSDDLKEQYSLNILAGLFYEIWYIGTGKGNLVIEDGMDFTIEDKNKNTYNCFRKSININGGNADASSDNQVGASDEQVYITLESLCSLINNYVTFKDSNSNSAYVTCSVFDREYDKDTPTVNRNGSGPVAPATDPRQFNLGIPGSTTTNTNNITPNSSTGEGGYLLCLGHPLQISMDPTICLINSPVWTGGIIPDTSIVEATNPPVDNNVVAYTNTSSSIYENLIKEIIRLSDISDFGSETENELIEKLSSTLKRDTNEIKQLSKIWFETNPTKLGFSLYSYLAKKLSPDELNKAIGESNVEFTKKNPVIIEKQKLEEEKKKAQSIQKKAVTQAKNLAYLEKLKPFFYKKDYSTELGIIGNIYVNVNFLYRLALNNNLESKDSKEQNDISLYDFLKSMLSEISSAIGKVNNFDIHVDPIDNVIRIIDVNYVDEKQRKDVYSNLFTLEMHNTKSTVRSYKLESQIFPDQASVVAIGAQVGGGAMATDNNTMLDFNKGLVDRIIPKKIDPTTDPNQANTPANVASQLANLSSILDIFYGYFERLGDTVILWIKIEDADFNTEKADQYKNALKDLIKFYQNLTNSNTKNRAIIPTKLSVTMDGIGGLVIGHMFKIPEDLLPKGYKGETLGSKLGYTVTGIGHSISNNDWTTNIDAQTIILDDPSGTNLKYSDLVVKTDQGKVKTATTDALNNTISANQNFRATPTLKNLITAAKQSIGFSTALIRGTQGGNVGCAAAVSVVFLRATGNQIHPNKDIELSTSELYDYLLNDTANWKKRDKWESAQPGDIIVTARGNQAGHTGVVIDTRNADGSYNIISNSSSGFNGSDPGTIQQNYSILKWGAVFTRNPKKTAAFQYIGPYN